MKALVFSHLVRIAALGLAFGLGAAGPVAAMTLPAGEACSFALQIDFSGTRPEVREFRDKDGNLVKTIQAGKGFQLTFTNLNNGTTLSLKTAGSVTKQTFNPDGTTTFVTTGHNVLILFPSDVPPGPTTTLTLGRVVFTVDNSTQVFTLLGTSGRNTDICAVLLS